MIPDVRPVAAKAAPGRAERAHRARLSESGSGIQASPEVESVTVAGNTEAVDTNPRSAFSADLASTVADEVARRTELVMVAQRKAADAGELEIDRMRTAFDLHEQERAEFLREWNAIRDLSMEQMKKDDEILKKWIALI